MGLSKSITIGGLKFLGWLLLAVTLLWAAWFASNNRWVDARPGEVPQALQLPAPSLPKERNGFYGLVTLDQPLDGKRLHWPGQGGKQAPGWTCNTDRTDCVVQWRAQAARLAVELQEHAEIGRRCEALAVPGFAMDEALPEPSAELRVPADQYMAKTIAPHVQNTLQCARWLKVQAVLAQQRGDQVALQAYLTQGDALVTGLLGGSRSLIGSLSAWRIAAEQWQLLVALAVEQPALTPTLAALIRPLPAEAQDPSRWIVAEAHFGRQVIRELGLGCALAEPAGKPLNDRLVCSPGVSFMPNATQQLMEYQWLQALALAHKGPLALLDWVPQTQGQRVYGLAWRNTTGHILTDVAMPGWTTYARRQSNLLLQHQAATLALQAAGVQAAQRSAWLAQQKLDTRLRERLQLDGNQIVARGWSADSAAEPAFFRYPIPLMQDT